VPDGAAESATAQPRLVGYRRHFHCLQPVPWCKMEVSIVVDGKSYPIRQGRVINVPAGPGCGRTTINMLSRDETIVETVADFQARYVRTELPLATHTHA
jgi:hypothetical protein